MDNKLAMGIDSLPMIEEAFQSIEGMEKFCDKVLESKLAPDHFYPKLPGENSKRDYEKGNTAAVMMVLIQGRQLGIPVMTSLQHVIPVNGLMSIKGDAAKAMVFNSGKVKKDSWKEEVTGSIESGDMVVTMTATRVDTGETLSRSFSVEQAKRAGLWVTEEMTRKQDGYKALKSAWWKYPQRMITYRALGFLARDLFPDVLHGVYTTEEAVDIPQDETIVIETTAGAAVKIDGGPKFQQSRSEQLTTKANLQIDKRAGIQEPKPDPDPVHQYPKTVGESYPVKPEEKLPDHSGLKEGEHQSIGTMLNGTPGFIPVYTEDELKQMNTPDINTLIECDGLMVKARDIDPQKNTHKKLRTILLAHYAGAVVPMIAKFDKEFQDPLKNQAGEEVKGTEEVPGPDPESDEIPMEPVGDQEPEAEEPEPEDPDQGAYEAGVTEGMSAEDKVDTNRFDIEVPELVDGKRSFEQVKTLFEEMASQAGLDNKAYESMVNTKFPQFQKYRTKEDFVYQAPAFEVNTLLNSI